MGHKSSSSPIKREKIKVSHYKININNLAKEGNRDILFANCSSYPVITI
jgi:hypothetical protein